MANNVICKILPCKSLELGLFLRKGWSYGRLTHGTWSVIDSTRVPSPGKKAYSGCCERGQ
jgi:hypothetical protein